MAYPCQCNNGCVQCSDPPSGCPSGTCLVVPSVIINTSIGPCGDVFTLDIPALETTDLTACTGSIDWSIISYGAGLTDVEIDSNGVLSGASIDATTSVPGTWYTITGFAKCDNSNLSIYFTVKVRIAIKCENVLCPEGQECSRCSGLCVDTIPDVILT